jgi:hypothetical protein
VRWIAGEIQYEYEYSYSTRGVIVRPFLSICVDSGLWTLDSCALCSCFDYFDYDDQPLSRRRPDVGYTTHRTMDVIDACGPRMLWWIRIVHLSKKQTPHQPICGLVARLDIWTSEGDRSPTASIRVVRDRGEQSTRRDRRLTCSRDRDGKGNQNGYGNGRGGWRLHGKARSAAEWSQRDAVPPAFRTVTFFCGILYTTLVHVRV